MILTQKVTLDDDANWIDGIMSNGLGLRGIVVDSLGKQFNVKCVTVTPLPKSLLSDGYSFEVRYELEVAK